MARLTSIEQGVQTKTDLPLHDCNQNDFADFYPLRDKDKDIFTEVTAGQNSSFKCLDWDD